MARLTLDNLIFSLPAVDTSRRRAADAPVDSFDTHLRQAEDHPDAQDAKNSETTFELSRCNLFTRKGRNPDHAGGGPEKPVSPGFPFSEGS